MFKKAISILPILMTIVFAIVIGVIFLSRRPIPTYEKPQNTYDFYLVDGKLNINTADAAMLRAVLYIDEKIALQIVAYREANGPYRDIQELLNVKWVTEEVFDQIADGITVGDIK